jgi:hypothetical protein
MKIADGLQDSPFGGVVKEVCVKIGMIAHLLGTVKRYDRSVPDPSLSQNG